MDVKRLAEIVEEMALQHDYPGFDVRSVKFGLPAEVNRAPAKMFGQALKHESVLVRVAALRWLADKPSAARPYERLIADCFDDADEWVRLEAVHCTSRMGHLDDKHVLSMLKLLKDESVEVRKASAKALGKLGVKSQPVLAALRQAAEDPDHEMRWKAQKALRQLGEYVA